MTVPIPRPVVLLRIYVVTLVLLIAACERHPAPDSPMSAPVWDAELELRIGAVDDPVYALTRTARLVATTDGAIVTMHPRERTIRVFDQRGVFVRAIGRPGQGPGEFSQLRDIGIIHDTLWVADGKGNFHLFGLGGDYYTSTPLLPTPDDGNYRLVPHTLLPDGSMLATPNIPARAIALDEVSERPFLRLSPDGELIDTVFQLSYQNMQMSVLENVPNPSGGTYGLQPFGDFPLVQFSAAEQVVVVVDRRVASSRGDGVFHVSRLTFSGDTLDHWKLPYRPTPIQAAMVDSIVEDWVVGALQRFGSSFEGRRSLEGRVRQAIFTPEYQPPIEQFVLGADGSVWLRTSFLSEGTARNNHLSTSTLAEWLIIAPSGSVAGRVMLPARLRLLAAEMGSFWAEEMDDDDVPYLVRYRVRSR